MPTLREYSQEYIRLKGLLDEALEDLRDRSLEWADREVEHKKAWSIAYLKSSQPNQKGREADASAATAESLHTYLVAERLARVAREAVESLRTQISALQSLLAAERNSNEAELYGSD